MKLRKILNNINYELIQGSLDIDIKDLCYDSRNVKENYGFVALKGIDTDGHKYILDAISKKASCIFIDEDLKEKFQDYNVTIIKLQDTRHELAYLSANLFDHPSTKLKTIAITGTKGKTTTSWMLKTILENAHHKVGVIGTMGTFINNKLYEHKNTTPESYLIQKYLKEMVENKCEYLIMEVSSQALKVGRVSNIIFDYAIYTNLSEDHVGPREHPTFEDYKNSKALLFKQSKIGIFNSDDEYYNDMVAFATCQKYTYGLTGKDLKISNAKRFLDQNTLGITFNTSGLINKKIIVSCPGLFSAYNASGAILLAKLLNISDEIIIDSLKKFSVPGRCEIINIPNNIKIIIDYAHNKISMESIIKTMKEYESGRVISIFGCGGGRSREIRYELGQMAGKYSDFSIITMDNPRNDDLKEINADIAKGIEDSNGAYKIIEDRKEAIYYAITNSKENDIIILMGKGHEKFQEIKGKIYPFDEHQIITEYK